MGITSRLLHLARSNLNALIAPKGTRGAGSPKSDDHGDDVPLDGFSDEELEAELELRRGRRRRQDEARLAREQAERAARERVRGSASTATSSAPTGRATSARPAGGTSANPRGPTAQGSPEQRRRASLYAQLETEDGAAMAVVKTNFRRLMRQHHPDMNGGSPQKLKAATERSMKLTAAYQELERLLSPSSR